MIKKRIALLIAVLMLVPMVVLAESGILFTHEAPPVFTFSYPDSWIQLTEDNVEALMNLGEAAFSNETISATLEQSKSMDMSFFYINGKGDNLNIICQEVGTNMDAGLLLSLVVPTIISQYESLFEGFNLINPGEEIALGDHSYLKISYSYSLFGADLSTSQYLITLDKHLVTITHTMASEDGAETIAQVEEAIATLAN